MRSICAARLALGAVHPAANRRRKFVHVLAAAIGELFSFYVAPQCFYRIEIWCITGKSLYHQPAALAGKVGLHDFALMRWQAIPYQNRFPSFHVMLEVFQEGHQLF